MAESSTELIPPLIAEAKEAGQYKFLAASHIGWSALEISFVHLLVP